jgi:hypothetical protein
MRPSRGWNDESAVRGRHVPMWPRCVVIPPHPLQVLAYDGLKLRHHDVFVGAQDQNGVLRICAMDQDEPGIIKYRATSYVIDTDGFCIEWPADQPYVRTLEDESRNAA